MIATQQYSSGEKRSEKWPIDHKVLYEVNVNYVQKNLNVTLTWDRAVVGPKNPQCLNALAQ